MLDKCFKIKLNASDGYSDGEDSFLVRFDDSSPYL